MASFSQSIRFTYNSFFRDITAPGDFLPTGFFATGTNRYNLTLTSSTFRISTGLNFVNADDVSITIRWGTDEDNFFTIDFADYGDRSDPYQITTPAGSDERARLGRLFNRVRGGNRDAVFEIENNPRVTTLEVTGQSAEGTGETGVQESDRAFFWEWNIATAQATATRWADIGVIGDTDDITIPDDLLREAGGGSVNRIRSRANQLRISLVGDNPRLSAVFEARGTIWIQNAATGENIAAVQDFGSFWNAANEQYRINSDAPFRISSRADLRTAIRTIGVGEPVRIIFARPAAGVEIYSATEIGTANAGLSAPRLEASIQTELGTGLVNVEKIPDLRIRARSGLATVSAGAFQPTNLGVTDRSLAATGDTNLASQVIEASAQTQAGTGAASARKPTSLRVLGQSSAGTGRGNLSALGVKLSAQSLAGTGLVTTRKPTTLLANANGRSLAGTARVNASAPELRALARTQAGTGAASTRKPTTLLAYGQTVAGTTRVKLSAPELRVREQTRAATASVNIDNTKGLRVLRRTRRGTAIASLIEPKIEATAQSGQSAVTVRLIEPKIGATAQSGEVTVGVDVELQTKLFIRAQSQSGTTRTNIIAPTLAFSKRTRRGTADILVKASGVAAYGATGAGTGRANLIEQKVKAVAQSSQGTAQATLAEPGAKVLARSLAGTARVKASAPELRSFAQSLAGTGAVFIKEPGIRVYADSQPGTGTAHLSGPGIKATAQSEPGTANLILAGARIQISGRSLAATGDASLFYGGLKIFKRTRQGTAGVSVFSPPQIKIYGASDLGSARVKTSAPPIRVLSETGGSTALVNIMIPDRPRDFVREARADGQPNPAQYSTDARGGIYSVSAVK